MFFFFSILKKKKNQFKIQLYENIFNLVKKIRNKNKRDRNYNNGFNHKTGETQPSSFLEIRVWIKLLSGSR